MLYMASLDEAFWRNYPYSELVTKTNAGTMVLSNYVNDGLDAVSLLVDLVLAVINTRRIRRYASVGLLSTFWLPELHTSIR